MPVIDIVTMRGEMPRVEPHLLPDEVAVIAKDCHFDSGVMCPFMGDTVQKVPCLLPPKPCSDTEMMCGLRGTR